MLYKKRITVSIVIHITEYHFLTKSEFKRTWRIMYHLNKKPEYYLQYSNAKRTCNIHHDVLMNN